MINDRFILGAIAGIGGNIVKNVIMTVAKKKKWAEMDGPDRAAGLTLPAHKVAEFRGRIIGIICDTTIASFLGVGLVYLLTITGKDKAILKGSFTGEAAWAFLFGTLGRLGVTSVTPVSSKTILSQYIAHIAFGATSTYLVIKLGDPKLFTGEIPLTTCPFLKENSVLKDTPHSSPIT